MIPYVLVSPGYLAGGNPWHHLTELLLRGYGWRDLSTVDCRTSLTSPDRRLHLTLDRTARWTWHLRGVTSEGQDWTAAFDAMVPVEYVTAVTEAAIQPNSSRFPSRVPMLPKSWAQDPDAPEPTAVSPDGVVHATHEQHHPEHPGPWHATCAVNGFHWWKAAFSPHAPPTAVAAFVTHIASPAPLHRMAIGTPLYGCERHTTLAPSGLDPTQEREQLEARIAAVRLQRLSAPLVPPVARTHFARHTR